MDVELEIEKLVANGEALARQEGKVVFIPGALPHERVLVTIIEQKKDYDRAILSKILVSSPNRCEPLCSYYGICGGCSLQHLDAESQLFFKEQVFKETMQRIGGFTVDDHMCMLPSASAQSWAYRSRTRFHVDVAHRRAGFLKKGSDMLVDISQCPVLCDSLNQLLNEKRDLLFKAARRHAIKEKRSSYIEVPAFAGDTEISLDSRAVLVTVAKKTFWVNSQVFFQSNRFVLPAMVDFIQEHTRGPLIVDLYAGVGTFSAFVEGINRQVVAVEQDAGCLALARRNLRYTQFFPQSAESWLHMHKSDEISTLIVDPPRGGLSGEASEAIISSRPAIIIYISCDSVTMARDCKRLVGSGYEIQQVQLFDLYPQTFHIESIVSLAYKTKR